MSGGNQQGREEHKQEKVSQVYELIQKAKGAHRSFTAYAKAAGVSPASLTKIKNGEYMPSPDVMRKLTSDAADPQGGVTYDDLMMAAGYADRLVAYTNRVMTHLDFSRENSFVRLYSEYEQDCFSLLYTVLVDRGVIFGKGNRGALLRGDFQTPDLSIEIMNLPITIWNFEFLFFHEKKYKPSLMGIYAKLGEQLRLPFEEGTKLSLVVNHRGAYRLFEKFDHALSFRGELSIILVDLEKKKLVDEVYLSNYHEGDRSFEVYLTDK